MQLPFKPKPRDAAAPQNPPWHPNFRNYERLPDIKAVRTVFFVNAAAITLALAAAGFVGFNEYSIHAIRNQIDAAQADIDQNQRPSANGVALYGKFEAQENRIHEVSDFVRSRPAVSPILVHLGQTLPKNIALSYFDLREKGLVLRGVVRGAPELASGLASSYVDQLRADKQLAEIFGDVALTSLNRNAHTGRLDIEISLTLKERPMN